MHVRPALSDGSGRLLRSAATRTVARWAVTLLVGGAGLALGTALIGQQAVNFFTAGSVGSDQDRLDLGPLATRSVVYAADGSQLGIFHDEEYRVPVPLARVPDHVKKAVLDAEDERFYDHGPLDLRAMARAMVNNLEEGQISEGGSTITQQLVKTVLLTSKQDVNRKLQEAALAIRLEDQMTKDQIFERYLNTVYFGNHSYGIQAAAERYYRTDVDKLTVGQATLLAGLIRNPVYADPYGNPEAAKERRDVIVDRMVTLGDLSPIQADYVKAEPMPPPLPEARGPRARHRLLHRVRQAAAAATTPAWATPTASATRPCSGAGCRSTPRSTPTTSAWPRTAWPRSCPTPTASSPPPWSASTRPTGRCGPWWAAATSARPSSTWSPTPRAARRGRRSSRSPWSRPSRTASRPTTPSSARPRA